MKQRKLAVLILLFSFFCTGLTLQAGAEPAKIDYSRLGKGKSLVDPAQKTALWEQGLKRLNGEELRELAAKATVLINNGSSQATGFFIDKGLMVTNYHVIAKGIEKNVLEYSGKKGSTRSLTMSRVLVSDPYYDLALVEVHDLRITPSSPSQKKVSGTQLYLDPALADLPCLKLAQQSDLKSGQKVFVYGNPRGYEGTFSEGIISGFRNADELHLKWIVERSGHAASIGNKEGVSRQLIQVSADIDHGSSGSALLNEYGEVIGVCSSGDPGDGKNMSYNFASPSTSLARLLPEARAKLAGLSRS